MSIICIMGCGRVGAALAEEYHRQGHEVYVIDMNQDAFSRLTSEQIRNRALLGDGTDPSTLKRARIEEAQVFIAVTNGDNRNILAAQLAKKYKVPQVICRIYDPKRHEAYKTLGITSICPTNLGVAAIRDALGAIPAEKEDAVQGASTL